MKKILILLPLLSIAWCNDVLSDDLENANGAKIDRATCDETKKIWQLIEGESDLSYFLAYINQARKGQFCYNYFVEASKNAAMPAMIVAMPPAAMS